MTPATRLLEDLRDVLNDRDPSEDAVVAALRSLDGVRALYPAAHAIGERVSVRDWLNLRTPDGPSELDFTGEVVGVQFIDGKVLYVVDAGAGLFASGRQVVDSAFVHPAPRTLPLYRAPGVSGGPDWTVEDVVLDEPTPTHFPMDGRRVGPRTVNIPLHAQHSAKAGEVVHYMGGSYAEGGGPFGSIVISGVSPELRTLLDASEHAVKAGRLEVTDEDIAAVTEESPGEDPYKPVTDKDRREAIARAVIRSKPGSEGGACDIDYRAAALVLFQLLDDIDTLDDACREDDAAFRRLALAKARRREDVGASFDGQTVAFIGERAYVEGERRTSEPSRAEGSPGVDARIVAAAGTVADVKYPANPDERLPYVVTEVNAAGPEDGKRLIFDEVDGGLVASWLYPDGHREPAGVKVAPRPVPEPFDYATLTDEEKAELRKTPLYDRAKELGLVPQSVTVATEARAFDPFDASFTDEERRGGERALNLFADMLEARERAPS